jgi:hypothetical protein
VAQALAPGKNFYAAQALAPGKNFYAVLTPADPAPVGKLFVESQKLALVLSLFSIGFLLLELLYIL